MPVLKKRGPYAVLIPAALTCAVLVAVWLYRVDPEDSVYSPKCVFYLLTGLKCPGCGSQRSIHALLHLQVGDAFRHNALLVLSIPFLALMCFSWMKRRRFPALYERLNGRVTVWTVFAVIIAWWIVRNIFQF